MQVRLASGEIKDVTTGVGRRLIQAGEAFPVDAKPAAKAQDHEHSDDSRTKRTTRPAKDRSADDPAS